MQAIVYETYGTPDVLHLAELPTPTPADDQILIKIHACSINGSDRENLIGKPLYARMTGLRKPGNPILGSDIAGTVAAVGKNHTEFQVGDELFGELPGYRGGFAEYVCTSGETLARKPANLTFAQAAAIPQAGVIALRGIQEKGQVQAGQQVLINGAGGSAGSFAIQLAKRAGAEVTGVDGPHQLAFMRSLGADHVIDYTKEEFTTNGQQYDLILDLIAHRSVFALPQALRPGGTYYVTGGTVGVLLQAVLFGGLIKRTHGKNVRMLIAPQNRADSIAMAELCTAGEITPMIDREFPLEEVPDAMRYIAAGHAKGKVVINVAAET
ncbi:MAG TPA: NAD(P)-dependent alcohol dehydrogenase [Caldilineaceae bacterium]|nr:NAD(P)-dependent alcohol dehydrogenase [Caldilineaceae bacterium]